jgi:hypothetical protein
MPDWRRSSSGTLRAPLRSICSLDDRHIPRHVENVALGAGGGDRNLADRAHRRVGLVGGRIVAGRGRRNRLGLVFGGFGRGSGGWRREGQNQAAEREESRSAFRRFRAAEAR